MAKKRKKPNQPPVALSSIAHSSLNASHAFNKALKAPYRTGFQYGEVWVATADIKAIHEASVRLTSNEQMEKMFGIFYQKFVVNGEDYGKSDFHMQVEEPTNPAFVSPAIANFFKEIQEQFFFFKGYPDENDTAVERPYYIFTEVPNYHFRSFESGFTEAVRGYYKSLLLSNNNQH